MSKEIALAKPVHIGNIPIQPEERLTETMKKRLEVILTEEFDANKTRFQYEINKQKKAILEDYKKRSGWAAKKIAAEAADKAYYAAKEKLKMTGFDERGEIDGFDIDNLPKQAAEVISEIISSYKKKIQLTKLMRNIKVTYIKRERAFKALNMTGIDEHGEIRHMHFSAPKEEKEAIQNVTKELESLETAANPLNNMRNKLIARLWMSTTMAEANSIIYEVMGNGVIKPTTQAMIEHSVTK